MHGVQLNVVLGGLVGAVLALCVGLLIFYLVKHPARAKKLLARSCINGASVA